MTSLTDWPPAIAPHLAVMERVKGNAELAQLRAFVALAASTCGMHNCNCPTAPKIRQALKELLENSPK